MFIGNGDQKQAMLTPEGGIAVWVINKTGAKSIKGYMCEPSATTDRAIKYCDPGDADPCGVVYDEVEDGALMRLVVSGLAEVYYRGDVTRGTFARVATAAEGGNGGQVVNEPLPSPPLANDKHFQECGHPIESRVGAGLALTFLHFN